MTAYAAPPPRNEAERLIALQNLDVLDTRAEPEFDELVSCARTAFDVKIALISLVDADRQWFKARCGLDVCQTGREEAFCAHAILGDKPFVVLNASLDRRFARNPLVTGAPHLRFYAGAPLILPTAEAIGTFCLIDPEPRFGFSSERARMLEFFAKTTVERLIARARLRRIAA